MFNGERFLAEAIASAARQTPAPLEIIVVDDGSDDGSAGIAHRAGAGVRYLHQPNQGPGSARNAGLAVARGDLVALLDADDLWPDDRTAVLLSRLERDPAADIALGSIVLVRTGAPDEPGVVPLSEPISAPHLGAALFRRSVFQTVGIFDPSLRFCEDVDWFLRAHELGVSIASSEAPALLHRQHEGNMTIDRRACGEGLLAVLRKSLTRRRSALGSGTGLPAAVPPTGEDHFVADLHRLQDARERARGHDGRRV